MLLKKVVDIISQQFTSSEILYFKQNSTNLTGPDPSYLNIGATASIWCFAANNSMKLLSAVNFVMVIFDQSPMDWHYLPHVVWSEFCAALGFRAIWQPAFLLSIKLKQVFSLKTP